MSRPRLRLAVSSPPAGRRSSQLAPPQLPPAGGGRYFAERSGSDAAGCPCYVAGFQGDAGRLSSRKSSKKWSKSPPDLADIGSLRSSRRHQQSRVQTVRAQAWRRSCASRWSWWGQDGCPGGPSLTRFGQSWPTLSKILARMRPLSGHIWPKSASGEQTSVKQRSGGYFSGD